MKKMNIGIAGTGSFAHIHASAIRALKNASLKAVYGRTAAKVKEFSSRYAIKGYTDLENFLNDGDLDIVDIVTQHDLHVPIGIKAALAGKNLIIEKPVAATLRQAEELVAVCRKQGIKASVISQHRYDPAYLKAKAIIEKGGLGKIIFASVLMRLHRAKSYFSGQRSWVGKRAEAGGGVLMMQAIHLLDILTWILGPAEVKSSCLATKTHQIEVEDTAVVLLEFKNNVPAVLMATVCASCNMKDRLEIHGENGSIIIEDHEIFEYLKPPVSKIQDLSRRAGFKITKAMPFEIKVKKRLANRGIDLQIKDFVDCLNRNLNVPSPVEEARDLLRLIDSIYNNKQARGC